jgi:hypothetical protein
MVTLMGLSILVMIGMLSATGWYYAADDLPRATFRLLATIVVAKFERWVAGQIPAPRRP